MNPTETAPHRHALLYGWLAGTYGLFCTQAGCDYFTPVKVDKVQPGTDQEADDSDCPRECYCCAE